MNIRDVERLIIEGTPPLDYGNSKATYLAAIRYITKIDLPSLRDVDPWRVELTREMLDRIFVEHDKVSPPNSMTEKNGRNQRKTRLRNICRSLNGSLSSKSTPNWLRFVAAVEMIGIRQNRDKRYFIPLVNSLKSVAIESGVEPYDVTREWLIGAAYQATAKRRTALCKAGLLLDLIYEELPTDLRPAQCPIGRISVNPSNRRRGRPLPPRLKAELEQYVMRRIAGHTAMGVNGPVQIGKGIDALETAPEYMHAFTWYLDCLIELGYLNEADDPDISYVSNIDQFATIVVEALGDMRRLDEAQQTTFPWKPIAAKTLHKRISFINKCMNDLVPNFSKRETLFMTGYDQGERMTARQIQKRVNDKIPRALSPKTKAFCRQIVTCDQSRSLLLNLHTVLWAEGQLRWSSFEQQTYVEQCQTLNLCALSAMTAITTSFPFRRRTVVELAVAGDSPDIVLPLGKSKILLSISPSKMKADEEFVGVIEDSGTSHPRRIIDWFIAGPRREILKHKKFLSKHRRDYDLLFCGMARHRYGDALTEWTEILGIKMTSHLFRHAIASILVNNYDCSLQQVAAMLGNTAATVARNYLFLDSVKHRQQGLIALDRARQSEIPNILHARMRGKRR